MTPVSEPSHSGDTRPLAFSYVRFSSEKQRQGASLERQTEAAKRWAEENGYILDASLNLHDLAVSAFKGDNTSIGKLGAFKRLAETDRIPKGSVLIVESLDRVSREHWEDAFIQLRAIMRCGIDIVTLTNGRWYRSDKQLDMMEGVEMILTFQRANEESLTKSKRVSDAWRRNTDKVKAGARKRSGAVPSWVKLVGSLDDGHFELIPGQVEITRELYERFASGEPVNSIATDFRKRGVKTPRGKEFRSGNVYRLVSSKAPFGILEIGKGTKNNRTVVDKIEGYFPRIVDEDVQRRVTMRLNRIAEKRTPLEAQGMSGEFKGKRKTQGILTGVIWSPERAGGNRAQVIRQKGDNWAYVDSITRRWVAKREVIERPFLQGWGEIVTAYNVDTTPEIERLEAAHLAAMTALEFAERKGSERLILAAQADLEEASEAIKEKRRQQALALQELPEDISKMEPWEANQIIRQMVERVDVVRGDRRATPKKGEDKRVGKLVMLEVKLKNGIRLYLGDTELLFEG